jgi:hypothetical protein
MNKKLIMLEATVEMLAKANKVEMLDTLSAINTTPTLKYFELNEKKYGELTLNSG